VDRRNPVLGNPYILKDVYNMKERNEVIDNYIEYADTNYNSRGDMYEAVLEIANMLMAGKDVSLACWCAPKRCHAEWIVGKVALILKERGVMSASTTQEELTLF
jgi:hypothetical protein